MNTRRKRSFVILAVLSFIIVVILSSFVYLNFWKPYSGNVESVIVGMVPNEVSTLIYIAQNQNYFLSDGLNVTFKYYPSGLEAVEGLTDGEVDIADASDYVFASQVLAGESHLRLVGAIDRFFNLYILARKDRGINQVADLEDKTIGVTLGTSPEFFLGRFLELNGLNLNQVTLVNIDPSQTSTALSNGIVDAVIAWQPNISEIEDLTSNNLNEWPAQSDQASYFDVICLESFIAAHNETVTRFLDALYQAEVYVINNPEKSEAIIQKELNYTAAYSAAVWPEHDFSLLLDQSQILTMQDESRWLISNNLTNATAVPNFVDYIYVDGLKSVKPESVNVIGLG